MARSVDLVDFIEEPDKDYDWIIPGFIERYDRMILTGWEGHGKSTLGRQIAVQAHLGIHPFTLEPVEPIVVLYIDLENGERLTRREFRKIQDMCGLTFKKEWVQVISAPEGLDLLHKPDDTYLQAQIAKINPELVVLGPMYKLSGGNPIAEAESLPVAQKLDALRMLYGFAIILEAHSPYAAQGSDRPQRPYGWSGWSRWPELGLHINKNGDFQRWRPDRDPRPLIPDTLERGVTWPWEPTGVAIFSRACAYAKSIGKLPSVRELEEHLGVPKSNIGRILQQRKDEWTDLL